MTRSLALDYVATDGAAPAHIRVRETSDLITFIVRRALLALLTIWALSMISFVVIQLPPGDFVDTYILQLLTAGAVETGNVAISESLEKALRTQYGLDQPV